MHISRITQFLAVLATATPILAQEAVAAADFDVVERRYVVSPA